MSKRLKSNDNNKMDNTQQAMEEEMDELKKELQKLRNAISDKDNLINAKDILINEEKDKEQRQLLREDKKELREDKKDLEIRELNLKIDMIEIEEKSAETDNDEKELKRLNIKKDKLEKQQQLLREEKEKLEKRKIEEDSKFGSHLDKPLAPPLDTIEKLEKSAGLLKSTSNTKLSSSTASTTKKLKKKNHIEVTGVVEEWDLDNFKKFINADDIKASYQKACNIAVNYFTPTDYREHLKDLESSYEGLIKKYFTELDFFQKIAGLDGSSQNQQNGNIPDIELVDKKSVVKLRIEIKPVPKHPPPITLNHLDGLKKMFNGNEDLTCFRRRVYGGSNPKQNPDGLYYFDGNLATLVNSSFYTNVRDNGKELEPIVETGTKKQQTKNPVSGNVGRKKENKIIMGMVNFSKHCAVRQCVTYMVDSNCRFGIITTGFTYNFLYFDDSDDSIRIAGPFFAGKEDNLDNTSNKVLEKEEKPKDYWIKPSCMEETIVSLIAKFILKAAISKKFEFIKNLSKKKQKVNNNNNNKSSGGSSNKSKSKDSNSSNNQQQTSTRNKDSRDENWEKNISKRSLYYSKPTDYADVLNPVDLSILDFWPLGLQGDWESELPLVGHGRIGNAYRKDVNGKDMVIKIVKHWSIPDGEDINEWYDDMETRVERRQEEMYFERNIYTKLSSIQGKYIPTFYFAGVMHPKYMSGFATSYEGTSLSKKIVTELDDKLKRQAIYALGQIHKLGVLHNDVELRNIVFQGESIKFIDFGNAKSINKQEDFLSELAKLKLLLEYIGKPFTYADDALLLVVKDGIIHLAAEYEDACETSKDGEFEDWYKIIADTLPLNFSTHSCYKCFNKDSRLSVSTTSTGFSS